MNYPLPIDSFTISGSDSLGDTEVAVQPVGLTVIPTAEPEALFEAMSRGAYRILWGCPGITLPRIKDDMQVTVCAGTLSWTVQKTKSSLKELEEVMFTLVSKQLLETRPESLGETIEVGPPVQPFPVVLCFRNNDSKPRIKSGPFAEYGLTAGQDRMLGLQDHKTFHTRVWLDLMEEHRLRNVGKVRDFDYKLPALEWFAKAPKDPEDYFARDIARRMITVNPSVDLNDPIRALNATAFILLEGYKRSIADQIVTMCPNAQVILIQREQGKPEVPSGDFRKCEHSQLPLLCVALVAAPHKFETFTRVIVNMGTSRDFQTMIDAFRNEFRFFGRKLDKESYHPSVVNEVIKALASKGADFPLSRRAGQCLAWAKEERDRAQP